MHDYGTVLETMERTVYHADSGSLSRVVMEAITYQLTSPALVITRLTLTSNATVVTGSYTVISGATLEEWKRNMEESDLMLWKPLPAHGNGLELN